VSVRTLLVTHDLACAFAELARAAKRHATSGGASGGTTMDDISVAAVALTIQLAIDAGAREPGEMRALECELIDKLMERA